MGAGFFPLDDAHEKLGRLARQFFAGFIADDGPMVAAFGAAAVLRSAGDDLFAPLQVFGKPLPSRMVGPGLLGPGQRGLFWGLQAAGFLLAFLGGDAGLVQQERGLGGGKLFRFWG